MCYSYWLVFPPKANCRVCTFCYFCLFNWFLIPCTCFKLKKCRRLLTFCFVKMRQSGKQWITFTVNFTEQESTPPKLLKSSTGRLPQPKDTETVNNIYDLYKRQKQASMVWEVPVCISQSNLSPDAHPLTLLTCKRLCDAFTAFIKSSPLATTVTRRAWHLSVLCTAYSVVSTDMNRAPSLQGFSLSYQEFGGVLAPTLHTVETRPYPQLQAKSKSSNIM